jgi:hypothetical protein
VGYEACPWQHSCLDALLASLFLNEAAPLEAEQGKKTNKENNQKKCAGQSAQGAQ